MNSKTRILSITHSSDLSGSTKSLLNLIQGTQDKINWIVIYRKDENADLLRSELKKLNIESWSLPFRKDIFRKINVIKHNPFVFFIELIYNFIIAIGISLYAKYKKIALIHTNSSVTCLGAYISKMSSIPHIWHFREFIDLDYSYRYKFGFRYLAFWANRANKIIAVSNTIYEKAVKNRGIYTDCIVIYNGVISTKDIPEIKFKKIDGLVRLSIVGFLDQAKNQLLAIKGTHLLLKKGYRVHLDIFGRCTDEYYSMLKQYVQENELQDFIHFRGFSNDLAELYGNSHINLMCSKNEAMGRVTVESMINSTPVAGYDAAGTKELIKDNVSGVLFKGNESDLCLSVEKLINNEHLYNKIIVEGYNEAVMKFNIELYSEKFISTINALIVA